MALESAVDVAITQNLERFLVVLSVSLGVVTISQISSWFRQIPYTLLLVIVGLGLAFVDIHLGSLSPELILEIFLPPLLFEAAWNIRWQELKENWIFVSFFAVFGVIISIFGVAFAVKEFTSLSLAAALLIGSSLATTDSVAVISLFREVGASKRLKVLMEGESLFNDGVAVVAFVLLTEILVGTQELSASNTLLRFCTFVGIGVATGCLIGFGISYLTQRVDLPLVEQSLTLVSAYGTYLITEELGGSGVIGVAIAGLILGNFGSRIGMSPRVRLLVTEFWEFIAFFVNSIVFLLIGDQINFFSLSDNLIPIGITVVAVLGTRIVSIYGLGALGNLIAENKVSLAEQTILWWGGLRGSFSIALALSVPAIFPGRQAIIETVFGVVLFTLLIQGLTTKWLLKKLNLIDEQSISQEYSELIARRTALKRMLDYFVQLDLARDIEAETYQYQRMVVKEQLENLEEKIVNLKTQYPQLRSLDLEQIQQNLLDIEANTYAEFIRAGRLNNNLSPFVREFLAEEHLSPIEINSDLLTIKKEEL